MLRVVAGCGPAEGVVRVGRLADATVGARAVGPGAPSVFVGPAAVAQARIAAEDCGAQGAPGAGAASVPCAAHASAPVEVVTVGHDRFTTFQVDILAAECFGWERWGLVHPIPCEIGEVVSQGKGWGFRRSAVRPYAEPHHRLHYQAIRAGCVGGSSAPCPSDPPVASQLQRLRLGSGTGEPSGAIMAHPLCTGDYGPTLNVRGDRLRTRHSPSEGRHAGAGRLFPQPSRLWLRGYLPTRALAVHHP